MFSTKDYSKMTLDELIAEEKKEKSNKTASAFFIGLMLGVIFIAVMGEKYVIAVLLVGVLTWIGSRSSRDRKALQAEISRRNVVD